LGGGKYQTMLVRDERDNPAAVKIENTTAAKTDAVKIEMRAGGGFIGRFKK
jgi:alpha-glucosidase